MTRLRESSALVCSWIFLISAISLSRLAISRLRNSFFSFWTLISRLMIENPRNQMTAGQHRHQTEHHVELLAPRLALFFAVRKEVDPYH
jgi:hypothetical protein